MNTGLFNDPGYKGTNTNTTVQFSGQDKERMNRLGKNPNDMVTDEYIENLQQQVHFMELELKILKEKVVDDEKKSGIGSLFDDEKTSHQHIQLLKTKYMEMRRDFDLKKQELQKSKLDVIGQQLIYDSQINAISDQTGKLYNNKETYEKTIKKSLFDKEKNFKDTQKAKNMTEADCRSLVAQLEKEQQDNYKNKMTLDKGEQFGDLHKNRYERDKKLINDHHTENVNS